MGAITATLAEGTEFSGSKKLVAVTATVASSNDTFTLTEAVHGISSLDSIVGACITGGMDADFTSLQVSITDAAAMTVQVKSFNQSGAATAEFTGTTIAVSLIGNL